MNENPTSLSNLRDIVVPPPVTWWPLAPGWWLLLTLSSIVALFVLVQVGRRWRANAYRRAALRALRDADNAASVAEVLKRAALVAGPRTQVASLTGDNWMDWLAETGGRPVPANVSRALTVGVFSESECVDLETLTKFAVEWIRNHKAVDRSSQAS